jgi:hypothetical protein
VSKQEVHFVECDRGPDECADEPGLESVTIVREGTVDSADRLGAWYWKVGRTKEGKYILFMPGLVRDGRARTIPINVAKNDERLKKHIVEMANKTLEVY